MLEQFGVALLEEGGDTPVAELAATSPTRSSRCPATTRMLVGRSASPAWPRARDRRA